MGFLFQLRYHPKRRVFTRGQYVIAPSRMDPAQVEAAIAREKLHIGCAVERIMDSLKSIKELEQGIATCFEDQRG